MNLSKAEDPFNLKNPVYLRADGVVDPLTQGIPRSWEVLDKMPKAGKFSVTYRGAPDNRNYQARVQMMEKYGFWKLEVEEDEVMWWSSLKEAPEDVLEYLEFITNRFETVREAFVAIDGEGGNGVVTLREFEAAYREMGCKKFWSRKDKDGSEESRRIEGVFRWLDPDESGQVSEIEFLLLDKLFKEITLSIREFVEFCERMFADLEEAWTFLDDDGSGEIDYSEWVEACTKIGYRGPVEPIFNYLDKDDEGHVSLDEFQELEKFQKSKQVA